MSSWMFIGSLACLFTDFFDFVSGDRILDTLLEGLYLGDLVFEAWEPALLAPAPYDYILGNDFLLSGLVPIDPCEVTPIRGDLGDFLLPANSSIGVAWDCTRERGDRY